MVPSGLHTVHGVARVRHDLATKPPPPPYVRLQLHPLASQYSIFPAQFVEKTVFLVEYFDTFVENHLTVNAKICSWAFYSSPLVCMSVFIASATLF